MPWWRYVLRVCISSDGVQYPEFMFGVGICTVLCMFSYSSWWFFVLIGLLGASGAFVVARIPARWVYLVSFAVIMASISALERLSAWLPILMVAQLWLLWKNRYIYPHFPFCQWWRKPEHYFSKFVKSADWPYFSGYMFGKRQKQYEGGFCLAE